MPGMNGLSGLDVVAQRNRDLPVAIISGMVSAENVVGALERGAIGFIPKTLGAKAMLGALQLMLAGERYVPSFIVDEVDRRACRRDRDDGRAFAYRQGTKKAAPGEDAACSAKAGARNLLYLLLAATRLPKADVAKLQEVTPSLPA